MTEVLHFPAADAAKLESYLPPRPSEPSSGPAAAQPAGLARPFVTLTFATSLDSSLALAPGVRTALSGPQSKAMTHYLRSRHDAILVGVGTAVADDPGLNCRIAAGSDPAAIDASDAMAVSAHQPRPIVIDPHDRWPLEHDSRVLATQRRGLGLAPYVVTAVLEPNETKRQLLESHGGKYIVLGGNGAASDRPGPGVRFRWEDVLASVANNGLRSVMIEGGGSIINTLLAPESSSLVDSVIVTIAPTWLGRGGVVVSPDRVYDNNNQATAAARLKDVKWQQLGDDVVLCGRLNS
ncbi:2,5-diamino-6-(ribosylamino)-4(3H)-pyrimidinone 5'-phosphate reductase [Sporothrix curviconia]|uniref:2,5-diamino-6-ribosylamino-4(3H)-pyrimidinone 5'-phosphate reductase n=1 Tax=Sporothrix curviconia TaxID=1260050 RepID=A0ABP0C7U8_9PEZI